MQLPLSADSATISKLTQTENNYPSLYPQVVHPIVGKLYDHDEFLLKSH